MMFLGYIHFFRALAITYIVAGHAIDAFVWESGSDTERVMRIAISNGSTLFVFIAGYLFQHLSGKFETQKYLTTKVTNVLLPYVLISIPAIVLFTLFMQREGLSEHFYDQPTWQQVFEFYITGTHLAPLWFVPMITLFYLVGPLLNRADKQQHIYYLLPVFFIISCWVPRGLNIQAFIHFFPVYLLGMFCSHYKTRINELISQRASLIALLLCAIALGIAEYLWMKGTMTALNLLQKTALCLFYLGLFYRLNHLLTSRFIGILADTSFGIFFIHSYILSASKLSYTKLVGAAPEFSILGYCIVVIGVMLSCVLIVLAVQKLFGKRSRMLIGS